MLSVSTRKENAVRVRNAGPVGSTDYPWTMFHYDAVRNGVTPASGPSSATLMWSYLTGSIVYPSPVVSDGFVFIPSYDGTLYAFDEYTGSLIWSFRTGGSVIGTPAVSNGMVFVASKDGIVYGLNEQTGSEVWRIVNDNLTPVTSSPVIANGTLFYGTFQSPSSYAEVLAVHPQTGTVIWKNSNFNDYIEGSPSVSGGRVFFGMGAGRPAVIIALNETTGAQLWSYATGLATTVTATPAEAYGNVYIGLDSTRFLAINQANGNLVWSFNTPGGSNATTPAIYNGVVYFGTGARIVYALNATTGTQIWTRTTGGAISSSPALALGSNALFIGSNDRYLYALSISTGAVLWRYLAGGQISSSPAVADGRVFFGSKDHRVYALGAIASILHDSLVANPAAIESGQTTLVTIRVTNGTSPIAGANVTLTSTPVGSFSTVLDSGSGTYQSNFTAPTVNSKAAVTLVVRASYTGYLSATNQTIIVLSPLPTLTVQVSPRPNAITPGGEITLMVRVTNGSILISGASLAFSSSAGGGFSSATDSGNGNYTAIFSTPLQSSVPVVTVQASKQGFTSGQGQTTVQVNGFPNLTTLKVAGFPFFIVVAGGVILFLLILALVVRKRKEDYRHTTPSPSFTY